MTANLACMHVTCPQENFTIRDFVAISGAHTIGCAHCTAFAQRISDLVWGHNIDLACSQVSCAAVIPAAPGFCTLCITHLPLGRPDAWGLHNVVHVGHMPFDMLLPAHRAKLICLCKRACYWRY